MSAIGVLIAMLLWGVAGLPALSLGAEKYAVQVGGFNDEPSSRRLLDKLTSEAFQCRTAPVEGAYYVVCGEFYSKINAERLRAYMADRGYSGSFVVSAAHLDLPLIQTPAAPAVSSAVSVPEPPKNFKCVQIGSFALEQNALEAIESLSRKGISCRRQKMNRHFKVYCGKLDTSEDARPLRQRIIDLGFAGTFVTVLPERPYFAEHETPRPAPQPAPAKPEPSQVPPVVFAPPPYVKVSKPAPTEPKPVPPQEREVYEEPNEEARPEGISGDIFGKDGGRLHPILTLSAYYTDNLYSKANNKKADAISVATLGFWAAVPGTKRHMLGQTTGSLPGGLRGSSFAKRPDRSFQAFALYKMDIEKYARYTAADSEHHTAEGIVSLASKGGNGIELSDIYVVSHESQAEAPADELMEFTSNRLSGTVTFSASERLFLRAGVTSFSLDYKKVDFAFKNHSDRAASASIHYTPSPKDSFFAEYTSTEIDYEEDVGLDSVQSDYVLGSHWEITGKTDGGLRAGWSTRVFDSSSNRKEASDFVLMANANYHASSKTRINLNATRERRESGAPAADYVLSEALGVAVTHSLTSKFSWRAALSHRQSAYMGVDQSRVDKDIDASLTSNYQIKKWLTFSSGYFREQRTTNAPGSEYSANRVFIGLSTSL